MRKTISLIICLTLLFALALTGITGCGGADVKTQSNTTTVSEGQQLMDLQRAYKSGAITQEQYEDQKQKILDAK